MTHTPFTPLSAPPPFFTSDFTSTNSTDVVLTPNQLRWRPKQDERDVMSDYDRQRVARSSSLSAATETPKDNYFDFLDSLYTIGGSGSAETKTGYAIHLYSFRDNMMDTEIGERCVANADGDFLIVPQSQAIKVTTELGVLAVDVGEIVVVPRGFRFAVDKLEDIIKEGNDANCGHSNGNGNGNGNIRNNRNNYNNDSTNSDRGMARGYILEVFSGHFQLPDLGPIGANGLANPRDFLTPVARFEDRDLQASPFVDHPNGHENDGNDSLSSTGRSRGMFTVIHKFGGSFFVAHQQFSPFNVVGWHGNYVPFKYDLGRFCPMNSVQFDHPDPSIFTVLSVPSNTVGEAIADFVVFPPRWSVAHDTFRPPYYHRNYMNEFMGLIRGVYEAKLDEGGFVPGGCSMHSCMTPHGPDTSSFEQVMKSAASNPSTPALIGEGQALDPPEHLPGDTLAFMFEMTALPKITKWSLQGNGILDLDSNYYKCWVGLQKYFPGHSFNKKSKHTL